MGEADRLSAALADRYRIVRELGAGGMAAVYLAEDLKHQRRVAIKVFQPALAETLGPERFLQEIRVVAGLSHPHIVPLFDSGARDGLLYFVMAYLDNESLRSRLERGRLAVPEALRIASQVADALAYAHARGVIHRDIKPENVLLTRSGHAIVVDFGIARAEPREGGGDGRITEAGLSLGTPAYMSPEQAVGDGVVDARTDQYSLALMCFEMLTGELPGGAASFPARLLQRLTAPAPSARAIRPEVGAVQDRVLRRALAPAPENRYDTMAEFAAALLQGPGAEIEPGEQVEPVIAVRPLTSLSAEADDRFLADGIAEEILTALAQVRGLRVAGRASSFAFRGDHVDLRRMVDELGVSHVLSGSMRRAGPRLRITAELAAAPGGAVIWTDRFDRQFDDIFAIQDEIAGAVTQALRLVLLPPSTRPAHAPNMEAHELFLRARSLTASGQFAAARAMIDRGLGLDPDSIAGKLSLALWQCGGAMYGVRAPGDAFPVAKGLATEVLESGPDATALFCLAWISWMHDWDARTARRHFETSLRLRADGRTRAMYAFFLVATGQPERGLDESGMALMADPFDFTARHERVDILRRLGRFEEALTEGRRVCEQFPGSPFASWYVASTCVALGRLEEAETWARRAVEGGLAPGEATLVQVLMALGRPAEARQILEAAEARSATQWVSPLSLAVMQRAVGDDPAALARLEQAVEQRDLYLSVLRGEPALDDFRRDARFLAVVREVGL
jgi:serine/threonine-protein kinase